MTHLSCYDDTDKVIQQLCDLWDLSEPEVIDQLLDLAADADDEVAEVVERAGL